MKSQEKNKIIEKIESKKDRLLNKLNKNLKKISHKPIYERRLSVEIENYQELQ